VDGTDDETDQRIADLAEERKFITPKGITAEQELACSPRTTRRRLDEAVKQLPSTRTRHGCEG
jgi:hypothetical protein